MNIDTLQDLCTALYEEIKDKNTNFVRDAIPISNRFFPYLSKKYKLQENKLSRLMEILVGAKMIFSFPVAEDKNGQGSPHVLGYIITKGDVIQVLRKRYEELFEKLYSDEFQKKLTVDKIIMEFESLRNDYNNTPLGIAANTVMMLRHYQSILERNILKFAEKIKEKEFADLIAKSEPLSAFIAAGENEKKPDMIRQTSEVNRGTDQKKKAADTQQFDEIKAYSNKNSIEKTIKMYGVEFYTRVCFRDYQYPLIQKMVEGGYFNKINDLTAIKKLLDKERMNSDKDIKINEHAGEINNLMKSINEKLKSFGL